MIEPVRDLALPSFKPYRVSGGSELAVVVSRSSSRGLAYGMPNQAFHVLDHAM